MSTYDQRRQNVNTQINIATTLAESGGCPECGRIDRVEKVSAIFSGGVSTITSGAETSDATNYTGLGEVSRSLLSSRLAPPIKPSGQGMSWAALSAALLLCVCGGLFTQFLLTVMLPEISSIPISEDTKGGYPVFFICITLALALVGGSISIVISQRRKVKESEQKASSQIPQWEKALARWNKLYYCARDDGVFDLEERVFVPVEKLKDYLYR